MVMVASQHVPGHAAEGGGREYILKGLLQQTERASPPQGQAATSMLPASQEPGTREMLSALGPHECQLPSAFFSQKVEWLLPCPHPRSSGTHLEPLVIGILHAREVEVVPQ